MADIGEIKATRVGANRDAEFDSRLMSVEISDAEDVATVEAFGIPGVDSGLSAGSRVYVDSPGGAWRIGIAAQDTIIPEADSGQIRIYSQAAGEVVATIWLRDDGTITFNDGSDNAVRFSELKRAFDDLKTQWDNFANAYIPGGPTAVGSPPVALPSTVSIDGAKVTEIKIP